LFLNQSDRVETVWRTGVFSANEDSQWAQQTKFVFVTGGVVSSLGKAWSRRASARDGKSRPAGREHEARSVHQRRPRDDEPDAAREVYVTDDGAETDLDLGHLRAFVSTKMSKLNNITTGQIYLGRDLEGAARRVPRLDGSR